ncbi:MAG: mechanosensitive ion channel family protein [Chloroflexota bacterium]
MAQEPVPTEVPTAEEQPEAPAQVEVQPTAQDEQIDERLTGILQATDWFVTPSVTVRDGVVFLDGQTETEEYQEWAGNLAQNTQDVVAVVNRIEVLPRSPWDFSPALAEMQTLWRDLIQAIPLFLFGIIVLLVSWWITKPITHISRRVLRDQLGSQLLTRIVSRAIAIPVFLLGLYLVLQVAGLTRLALTLLGGTGVVGIVIGFAFRDIAENFLASVLLSIRKPFRTDDFIEVAGYTGIVQQMNTRSTVLMTLDGNHIQIPNATVFKNTIVNYSANPNRRSDFAVGIGYDDAIPQAQELISQILDQHPAVLRTPEPLVLVDELGAATVNLRIYFWYDATLYAPIKITSSLIRLTKRTLEKNGISMPDEAREVIFPQGVPVIQPSNLEENTPTNGAKRNGPPKHTPSDDALLSEPLTTEAEGHLHSEEQDIRKQAERSRTPEEGENLLEEE